MSAGKSQIVLKPSWVKSKTNRLSWKCSAGAFGSLFGGHLLFERLGYTHTLVRGICKKILRNVTTFSIYQEWEKRLERDFSPSRHEKIQRWIESILNSSSSPHVIECAVTTTTTVITTKYIDIYRYIQLFLMRWSCHQNEPVTAKKTSLLLLLLLLLLAAIPLPPLPAPCCHLCHLHLSYSGYRALRIMDVRITIVCIISSHL